MRKTYKTKPQKVRPKTCSGCGLEAIDDRETRGEHVPATPDVSPCKYCQRNPEVAEEVFDFYSETWVLEQLADGRFSPTIEDPDKHEQVLLNVVNHCQKVYGSCKT